MGLGDAAKALDTASMDIDIVIAAIRINLKLFIFYSCLIGPFQ